MPTQPIKFVLDPSYEQSANMTRACSMRLSIVKVQSWASAGAEFGDNAFMKPARHALRGFLQDHMHHELAENMFGATITELARSMPANRFSPEPMRIGRNTRCSSSMRLARRYC